MSCNLLIFILKSMFLMVVGLPAQAAADIQVIEGRAFVMGNKVRSSERPIHQVQIETFGLMVHEVTVGEYGVCVDAGGCVPAYEGPWCNSGQVATENHPINCVTWSQAAQFCQWSGLRLPSESEWEFAAKSEGQDFRFPWGNGSGSCEYAVGYDTGFGCGRNSTWEVCSKPLGSTQQGLCDMGGNVWEWTADDAHEDYVGAPRDGRPWLDTIPNGGSVQRGGGFMNFIPAMETTYRRFSGKDSVGYEIGFRCAKSI